MQMNQLFYNLISNALKFSVEDVAPVINISLRMLSGKEVKKRKMLNDRNSYCEIIFKDNGIGFKQKYEEQIFTIFLCLNQPSQYLGTGIGLAMSKKILENHHGKIYVEATQNSGVALYIILSLPQFKPALDY